MRDKIMAMKAGRELDALVAEKVMNLCVLDSVQMYGDGCAMSDKGFDEWMKHPEFGKTDDPDILPPYSTDISAAWEVLETSYTSEIKKERLTGEKWNWVVRFNGEVTISKSVPEAICKAALLAVIES